MAKFEPTDEQRGDVALMAAGRLSLEEMAATIINPRTGKPITVKTFKRVFAKEVCDPGFKKEILEAFREQVRNKNWRAIQYGMDNIVGFADAMTKATATAGPDAMKEGITVRFISSPHSSDPKPIDITPQPAPAWPKSIEHQATPRPQETREPPIIDSRDEALIKPIAEEVPDGKPLIRNPTGLKHIGDYQTELDDPAVLEANKPLHRRRITTHDPGVVQRRLDWITFNERVRRANAKAAKEDGQNS
jgi:hypothetical protein